MNWTLQADGRPLLVPYIKTTAEPLGGEVLPGCFAFCDGYRLLVPSRPMSTSLA